ncbi:hypothetical protein [Streptomyces sp. VRA16 Mangrove soil]|uniref:hypothetical protein n=1 Tax=Streptomyces sp. VRA16 Mangrove soil TaxID=2817434 RepID=UPI001A9EAF24|nr:hypothetical protein [Streptomyces sp. VRA16 Mangrove soil]MBO1334310.1 hypothetical protein [Streptomyces sp. VRA16 Mangrove soil]
MLANLANAASLTTVFSNVLYRLRPTRDGHDPGRVAVDPAVMLIDGGEAAADLAVPRDRHEVFGPIASTPTAWPVLVGISAAVLNALRAASAEARELASASRRDRTPHARLTGRGT